MSNDTILNRFFTKNVISNLIQTGSNEVYKNVVRRFINNPESKCHGEIISEIYKHISKEKRNEYFYLNTLLNKLLVSKHNVNTTTALTQLWIGQSKADFVMINGVGKVYEIKSELDNFERLEGQLRDYYKAFSLVNVVTSTNDFERIVRILSTFSDIGNYVGVYALTDRDTISKAFCKEPEKLYDFLNYQCIFKLLRKCEYENIIIKYFGKLPETTRVNQFRACLELFCEIPILTAQELAFKELKKRNRIEKIVFESIPYELKSVVYFSGLSRKPGALNQMMETKYRG